MTPRSSGAGTVHFIVVDDRGRLLSGACSSPDVAGLIALLDDEPGSVRSLKDAAHGEHPQTRIAPRGWRVLTGNERSDAAPVGSVGEHRGSIVDTATSVSAAVTMTTRSTRAPGASRTESDDGTSESCDEEP